EVRGAGAAACSSNGRADGPAAPFVQRRGWPPALRPAARPAPRRRPAAADPVPSALRRAADQLPAPRPCHRAGTPARRLCQERDRRCCGHRGWIRGRHVEPCSREERGDATHFPLRAPCAEGPRRDRGRGRRAPWFPRAGRDDHGSTVRMSRAILHCDLDAFYASVEQRDHPEYRGKPVIVGGDGPNERGVVMAASYEARAFGVRSAMPLAIAGRLCPHGIYVPGNFDRYVEASDAVMAIFEEQTPLVEPISLDEAFLDVTATEHLFGGAVAMATQIKRAVRERCGLVVSVGVATNKLCAKIGSDLRKPDGLVIVPAGGEAAFLAPLTLERLWGVGPRTREVLAG